MAWSAALTLVECVQGMWRPCNQHITCFPGSHRHALPWSSADNLVVATTILVIKMRLKLRCGLCNIFKTCIVFYWNIKDILSSGLTDWCRLTELTNMCFPGTENHHLGRIGSASAEIQKGKMRKSPSG